MDVTLTGYVLRSVPYKESDVILTFLTPQGLVSAKARGLLKGESKLRHACQVYTLGEYSFASTLEQGHKTLTGAVVKQAPTAVLQTIEVAALLGLFAEAITKIEVEEDVDVFGSYDSFYRSLMLHPDYRSAYLVLLAQFLHWTGTTFEVDQCVNCGSQKNIVTVSTHEGGLLCARCNRELAIPLVEPEYLKLFRYVMKAPIDKFYLFEASPVYTHRLSLQLFDYLESMAGLTFKSQDVLAAIL